MNTEQELAHTALIAVDVMDVNDWIPNFELNNYQFKVSENAVPGTIIGQIVAFDQDRDVSFHFPSFQRIFRKYSRFACEYHFTVCYV